MGQVWRREAKIEPLRYGSISQLILLYYEQIKEKISYIIEPKRAVPATVLYLPPSIVVATRVFEYIAISFSTA